MRKKSKEIYDEIVRFALEKGYLPSVREICDLVGLKSTSSVAHYLVDLSDQGLIERELDSPRYKVKGLTYQFDDPFSK